MSVRGFDITKNYNREEMLDFLRDFLPDDFEQIEEQTFFEFTNIEEEVAFWEGYRRYLERAKDLKLQSYGSDTDIKGYANYDEAEITALKDSFKDQYGEYHHPLTEDHEVISEEAAEEIARTMLINSAAQDIYTIGQHQRQLDNEFFAGPDLGGN